jgi:hypothetical protein
MECWVSASSSERRQYEAIAAMTGENPELLKFLFDQNSPRLRAPASLLLKQARGLASGDNILVRVALDIWCDQGKAAVHELFNLESHVFMRVLEALAKLRG